MTQSIAEKYASMAKARIAEELKPKIEPDERFESDKFKLIVRSVLESLGYESNVGNFKMLNPFIDWIAVHNNTNNHYAYCGINDRKGDAISGKFTLVTVRASNKKEALKNINNRQYSFIRWW